MNVVVEGRNQTHPTIAAQSVDFLTFSSFFHIYTCPVFLFSFFVTKNEPRTVGLLFYIFLFLPDFYDGATIERRKNTWKWE